jgi:Rrf2 family protein
MLLTKTSELAIHSLLYLAQKPPGYLLNPPEIAGQLGESRTYISKVLRMVAQGGLLRSHRGVAGGFELQRRPRDITLLDIVEICQGTIPGHYCGRADVSDVRMTCGYHRAMHDLRDSTRAALGRWTLDGILAGPRRARILPSCMMRRFAMARGGAR